MPPFAPIETTRQLVTEPVLRTLVMIVRGAVSPTIPRSKSLPVTTPSSRKKVVASVAIKSSTETLRPLIPPDIHPFTEADDVMLVYAKSTLRLSPCIGPTPDQSVLPPITPPDAKRPSVFPRSIVRSLRFADPVSQGKLICVRLTIES